MSCSNREVSPVKKELDQNSIKNSYQNFSGKFFGEIPCADCPGIKATVNFRADSTFIENLKYIERNASFADTGKWSISGKIITVSFKNNQSYFMVKSDSSISMLDGEKKEIEGSLADNYILKRKE